MKNVILVLLLPATMILVEGCNHQADEDGTDKPGKEIVRAGIEPPLEVAEIPYTHYTFQAEEGGRFKYPSGTEIYFPAGSVLDDEGKPVTGKVEVAYREFHNPADIFLSGINMVYDSAGVSYMFESAGMCDIDAMQNGKTLRVNPEAKPVVNMRSMASDNNFNLYYLNPETGTWQNRGKDSTSEVETEGNALPELPVKPVEPVEPTGKRPVIEVKIRPDARPELTAFNKMLFEVHEDETRWDEAASRQLWVDMSVESTEEHGIYQVSFMNGFGKFSVFARPVCEAGNLESALKKYELVKAEYDSLEKVRVEAERIMQEEQEKLALAMERAQQARENVEQVVRSFEVSGFGVWNCDRPVSVPETEVRPMFVDQTGFPLPSFEPVVVQKGVNAVYRCREDVLRLNLETDNMVWGIVDDKLVYVSSQQIQQLNIVKGRGSAIPYVTIKMTRYHGSISSPDDIWKALENV